jgi:hypothetical protein
VARGCHAASAPAAKAGREFGFLTENLDLLDALKKTLGAFSVGADRFLRKFCTLGKEDSDGENT